ncbi:MAG TPA: hypothetical protein VK525_21980 [Candidatus Saccharimonadales bacterium]|nr:hypothetical protein [Candidatus Saccharimonadales bacterium]
MNMFRAVFGVLVLSAGSFAPPQPNATGHKSCCGEITAAGRRLTATLDAMKVESLWLAHEHVNWETGEADRGGEYRGPDRHTHCSAFAAAVAKRMDVYLLRPPEHGQQLLANAQAVWLGTEQARRQGWQEISGAERAQTAANRGHFVLVVYANPDSHAPGHIAIVRPSEKSAAALERHGPQIIQAGTHNHTSTTVRIGFSSHPEAWPAGVRYYVHELR